MGNTTLVVERIEDHYWEEIGPNGIETVSGFRVLAANLPGEVGILAYDTAFAPAEVPYAEQINQAGSKLKGFIRRIMAGQVLGDNELDELSARGVEIEYV